MRKAAVPLLLEMDGLVPKPDEMVGAALETNRAVSVRVVNLPVLAVVAPIAVELIPVDVVLKLDEVMVRALPAPIDQVDGEAPVRLRALELLKARALAPVELIVPAPAKVMVVAV